MDKTYWLRRKRAAMEMARTAATSEARLIHYELAGRYSIKAAHCIPFMLPDKGPATQGERAALQLRLPPPHRDINERHRPQPRPRKGPGFAGPGEGGR